MINVRGVLGWMRWRVMRFAAMAVLSGFLPALTQPLLALDPTIGSPRQNRVIGIGGHIGRATEAAARPPKRSVANAARPSQNRPAPSFLKCTGERRAGRRSDIDTIPRAHTHVSEAPNPVSIRYPSQARLGRSRIAARIATPLRTWR